MTHTFDTSLHNGRQPSITDSSLSIPSLALDHRMAQETAEKGLRTRLKDAQQGFGLFVAGREVQQKEVAEMAGMEEGTVNRYFRGETIPPLDTIVALARVLQVDPGWIAFGEDSQAPKPFWRDLSAPTAMPRPQK
jgi:transcriptional regulator with XRE-family HTH domain